MKHVFCETTYETLLWFSNEKKTVEINVFGRKTDKLEEVVGPALYNDIDGSRQTHGYCWLVLRVLPQGSVLSRCLIKSIDSKSGEHRRARCPRRSQYALAQGWFRHYLQVLSFLGQLYSRYFEKKKNLSSSIFCSCCGPSVCL